MIKKFNVYLAGQNKVPDGKILLIAAQNDELKVWIQDYNSGFDQYLYVYATGEEVEDDLEHVGSAIVGPYVWHVFR